MSMGADAYTLLGLTALVGGLVGLVVFALARFLTAARDTRRRSAKDGAGTDFPASALEEAVVHLKAQQRATAARAEASERLSGEIVASMTSGLLVVDEEGMVRMLNPAALRMLGMTADYTDPV